MGYDALANLGDDGGLFVSGQALPHRDAFDWASLWTYQYGPALRACLALPCIESLDIVESICNQTSWRWDRAIEAGEQIAAQLRERYGTEVA